MRCWYCQRYETGSDDPDEPCETCDRLMETHIIVISYSEERTKDERYPFRTGGFITVTEALIREKMRFFPEPEVEKVIQDRCCVLDDAWVELWKLPRVYIN